MTAQVAASAPVVTRPGGPGSAAGADTRPEGRPRQAKVVHLYWVREGRAAAELGVEVRHLCGNWGAPPRKAYAANPHVVEVVGGLMPLPETRDCKNCVRVLEATLRRRWEAQN